MAAATSADVQVAVGIDRQCARPSQIDAARFAGRRVGHARGSADDSRDPAGRRVNPADPAAVVLDDVQVAFGVDDDVIRPGELRPGGEVVVAG